MARPTKLTDELIELAAGYVASPESFEDVVPTVAGLACVLDVRRETLQEWHRTDANPVFSNIFLKLLESQERKLVNGGLAGGFNPAVTKMMLTKHGYSDKIEQEHSNPDGSLRPTTIQLVAPNEEE